MFSRPISHVITHGCPPTPGILLVKLKLVDVNLEVVG